MNNDLVVLPSHDNNIAFKILASKDNMIGIICKLPRNKKKGTIDLCKEPVKILGFTIKGLDS